MALAPFQAPEHHPAEHEYRRARDAAQSLANLLELAGLDAEAAHVRRIRDGLAVRLAMVAAPSQEGADR